jgi:hypothetical protein
MWPPTKYNPYLHILGHEAATSPATGYLSAVNPVSLADRGKGILSTSDISSAALDNSPLAKLLFGLSPPTLVPSLGPPVHPTLPPSPSLYFSSPSSFSNPTGFFPPPISRLLPKWLPLALPPLLGLLSLAHLFLHLRNLLPENSPLQVLVTTLTIQQPPLVPFEALHLLIPHPLRDVLVTILDENDLLLLEIWIYLHHP